MNRRGIRNDTLPGWRWSISEAAVLLMVLSFLSNSSLFLGGVGVTCGALFSSALDAFSNLNCRGWAQSTRNFRSFKKSGPKR